MDRQRRQRSGNTGCDVWDSGLKDGATDRNCLV